MVGLARGAVEIRPYSDEWAEAYEAEIERLRPVVGDAVVSFEHVGSTAVEGLAAKPVVDVLALVSESEQATDLVSTLEVHGYEYRPNDTVSDRLFLAKGSQERRTHYLSLTEPGSEVAREQLAFRDHLRANPEVAAEYEALKRELASRYTDDRATYTREKSAFVERVLNGSLGDR